MKTRSILGIVAAVMPMTSALAGGVTFDEPGYVAGSIAPSPWLEEHGHTSGWGVAASLGYGGTQALVVDYPRRVAYDLPTPLTSAMGAQRISILFDPAGPTSTANFLTYGGVLIGNGSFASGTEYYLGVVFRKQGANNHAIYGPSGYPGTYMSNFTPSAAANWYEIIFDINAGWDEMTISVGPVGSAPVSQSFAWSGGSITRVWPAWGDSQWTGQAGIYDNLVITPEPAALGLLAIGGLAVIRRRRK